MRSGPRSVRGLTALAAVTALFGCGLGTVAFEGDQAQNVAAPGDDDAPPGDGGAIPSGDARPDVDACAAPRASCPIANAETACVDLRTNVDHCGACNHPCSVGECTDGDCQRVVFLTSTAVKGAFGGLAAGDQTCNAQARTNPALRGSFKAWLSTSAIAVSTRMTHGTRPYVLPDGTVVAADFAAFASKSHLQPIAVSATNVPLGKDEAVDKVSVWTGTTENGSSSTLDCDGWTKEDPVTAKGATVGNPSAADERWTNASSGSCNSSFGFYCVEQ